MERVHAFTGDALGDLDAVGVAEAIRGGQISRQDAVNAAIARTEKVNPELNALAFEAFERARIRAEAPYGGFFDGVPTFVKDNTDVAGMPTMHGTDAWEPRPATADGDFTKVFRSTGLIPLGKTRMPEFGFSASPEHPRHGPVRNPWNTEYTPGASSSGATVLVAAGAVPIAHANDGGGSIRIPASCAGLVGLKPSRGRLPLERQMRLMPIRLGVNGVLTRSVRDTAAFYREMESVWANPKLPPVGDIRHAGTTRLRVAVLTRSLERECTPEVREQTLRTAALLEELGHHVEHLDTPPIPKSFTEDFVAYWGLLALGVVRTGRRELAGDFDRDRLDNLTLGLERHAQRNLHRMPIVMARLASIRRGMNKLHRSFDVVLMPTLAGPPPRLGHLDPMAGYQQIMDRLTEWVAFTPLQNVTGDPAISLPLAQSADGLPIGMMLAAPLGQEARLLKLAYEVEEARPFRRIQD